MQNIIVATTVQEQQDVLGLLKDKLKSEYHSDPTVTVVQSGLTKIDILHRVKGVDNLASTYKIVIIPLCMNLDSLKGFSHTANININMLLSRLDKMKAEAISFVNLHKIPSNSHRQQRDALTRAAKNLFC